MFEKIGGPNMNQDYGEIYGPITKSAWIDNAHVDDFLITKNIQKTGTCTLNWLKVQGCMFWVIPGVINLTSPSDPWVPADFALQNPRQDAFQLQLQMLLFFLDWCWDLLVWQNVQRFSWEKPPVEFREQHVSRQCWVSLRQQSPPSATVHCFCLAA